MIRTVAVDPKTKRALHVEATWNETHAVDGTEVLPVYLPAGMAHGTFKAAVISGAATTIVTSPNAEGSLMLTDLFVSADKVNNASVTVQFADGTRSIPIIAPIVTDAPVNLGAALAGRWQGWKDARVEVVTDTAGQNVTVSVGYIKMPTGLPYDEWDSLR
jgi:hypothetical protein